MAGIVTIPPHCAFLSSLAAGLLADGRERLADTLLLLPSRRACLQARDALARAAGGRTILLPRLVPVGELDGDELLLDAAAELDLPPAMPLLRRHLLLTRLILARGGIAHEQAVRLAGELARLIDELATEGVPFAALATLVPGELAQHWQLTLDFLRILETAWPSLLAAEGRLDPAQRRGALLDAVGRHWRQHPPAGPVVAAGIGGSIPAVARLLATVAGLPDGLVVLQGLDRDLDPVSWTALGAGHPQYHLRRLLDLAGVDRAAVADWPATPPPATHPGAAAAAARAVLWREVLRPAATSDGRLAGLRLPPASVDGVTVLAHRDLATEALSIALRLRAALEMPGRTAALVTPDRNLARRVAVELRRWDIEADDSAGVPLDQSPPGSFLLLSAHLVVDALAPPSLLAALKHPLATGGTEPATFRRHLRAVELAILRGPRPTPGFAGLLAAVDQAATEGPWRGSLPPDALRAWISRLADMAAPLVALVEAGSAPLQSFLRAHLAFAEALAADAAGSSAELWAREAGARAQDFMRELGAAADALEAVPASAYPALMAVLMAGVPTRSHQPTHPRVAILGQLESRLVEADLVIIGSLVEGVWPPLVESGPWLNRRMRETLGLPPVEQAIGIAAADFVAAASAPELVLTRAGKDVAGAPATASRWLQRLAAVTKAAGLAHRLQPDPSWAAWLTALDAAPGPARPCAAPAPRPARAARPRQLTVSDIEQLLRNPYGLYAHRILGLTGLEPIDAEPGAARRGDLIHQILHRFVARHPVRLPPQPLAELLGLGRKLFAPWAREPLVATIWWPRFLRIAEWFIGHEQARRDAIQRIAVEVEGGLEVPAPGGAIRIRARADRVEVGRDGTLTVVDYKTGQLPKADTVELGLAPQLPIEGLIAAAGGFADIPAGPAAALLYWRLTGAKNPGEERAAAGKETDVPALILSASQGLARLLAHFDEPATAYVAVPRPEVAPGFDPYEHLARIAEWRGWGSGQ